MVYLSALRRCPDASIESERFHWTLPVIRALEELVFTTPVTFLVGENGSGKSTLLEGIAVDMDAVAAGARVCKYPSWRPWRSCAARRRCLLANGGQNPPGATRPLAISLIVVDAASTLPLYAAPGHAPPPGRFSSERES
jgi:hypothetical protein